MCEPPRRHRFLFEEADVVGISRIHADFERAHQCRAGVLLGARRRERAAALVTPAGRSRRSRQHQEKDEDSAHAVSRARAHTRVLGGERNGEKSEHEPNAAGDDAGNRHCSALRVCVTNCTREQKGGCSLLEKAIYKILYSISRDPLTQEIPARPARPLENHTGHPARHLQGRVTKLAGCRE